MKNGIKTKRTYNMGIYTILVVLLLISLFLLVVNYTYMDARDDGFEKLHFQVKELKEDIELQMFSDRENLVTMANLAAKLYSNGEDYDVLLKSFKPIGLIEEVGILTKDNVFITRVGSVNMENDLDFAEESRKGSYISGRIEDATVSGREIVRSAVPIVCNEETVGMLYGVITLESLEKRLKSNVSVQSSQLFIFERGNGNFIVNTVSDTLGNITVLSDRKFLQEYSYDGLRRKADKGKEGYTAFKSKFIDANLYAHYAPLEVADWQIMVAEPEETVFSEAEITGKLMAMTFVGIVLIMGAYLFLLFSSERRKTRMHLCASKIRKLLLGISQQESNIGAALKNVVSLTSSRSAFFVDTDGEDYNYIVPAEKPRILTGEDRAYFISRLLNYADSISKNNGTTVNIIRLVAESHIKEDMPQLYKFMKDHHIRSVVFASVLSKNKNVGVLGVINPQNYAVARELLEDVSICFSMAIYNKKYLKKTEAVAVTDSLTGLSNRMAYKRALLELDEKHSEDFSCIYIDVNELHVINNKYGHTTGDGMLLFISNVLREVFSESSIYRIGGDEFLVFSENIVKEVIEKKIQLMRSKIEEMNYHVSVGMDFCKKNMDAEEIVKNAEKRMYEDKARYYQQKEQRRPLTSTVKQGVDRIATGIYEVDALLNILGQRYYGIYCVSLENDSARRILIPEYLKHFSQSNEPYSRIFAQYVEDMVSPDYHRGLLSFLKYDAIKGQLAEGYTPSIRYANINGDKVRLTVYPMSEENSAETLWVFENEE